jgi:beta-lactamase class A
MPAWLCGTGGRRALTRSSLGMRENFLGALLIALMVAAVGTSGAHPALASTQRTPSLGDARLQRLLDNALPRLRAAGEAADAGRGSPEAVQAQYDASRDLEQSLARLPPLTRGCEPLRAAAAEFATAQIRQAEGFDRPSRVVLAAGVRQAAAAERALTRLHRPCSSGPTLETRARPAELEDPRGGEAFPGLFRSRVPAGTTVVDVAVNGHVLGSVVPNKNGVATGRLRQQYGRWKLSLRYRQGKRLLSTVESRAVWLLPKSADDHVAPRSQDRRLAAQLALLASGFDGKGAIWVHNLATGSVAGWNEDARFPAASTVKLAVLIAALHEFGPRPERSALAYDLQALAAWSSNLAANRLLHKLGGSEDAGSRIAQQTLSRLGATSSTYTGDYRLGTAVDHSSDRGGAPDPPPLVSRRVTTARDLGRILYLLHAGAMGDKTSLRRMRLTIHEARVGLALLVSSEARADNLGLLRPNLPGSIPIAQKNGWLRDARHTAGIVYREAGPTIVVVLTYRPGITRIEAARFAANILKASFKSHSG